VKWLLVATPLLLITHAAAVLPHEFTHSVVAWILGLKDTPGNIDWGGTSLLNILLLIHIDENVDYSTALTADKNWQVALVAFAGPGLANGGLYLLSRRFITAPAVTARPVATYVLFWFLLMNVANLYDYVPIRTFASDGDVHHFILATGWSPWAVYVVGGYLVLWAIVDFYRTVLPLSLDHSVGGSPLARGVVLATATAILFGYFAIPGFEEDDDISLFMARTSLMIIPVIIILLWRRIVPSQDSAPPEDPAIHTTSRLP
jgi:hypothetical protein